MMEKNKELTEKIRAAIASQPKIYVSDFDRKCFKKELCKALEAADEIITNLYAQMYDDPTWTQAATFIEELILHLDNETN